MRVLGQTSPLVDWDWIGRNIDQIADRTWQHLSLTAVSVGIGLVISVALAIVALRWRWSYTPITWVTGLLYTIRRSPSSPSWCQSSGSTPPTP